MGAGTYAKQGGENVSAEIIIAGLSLLGTLAGTAGGIIVSGKLVNYRIEQLEKKVEKHNNLITRTFRLEQAVALLDERVRVANHRISDLETIPLSANGHIIYLSDVATVKAETGPVTIRRTDKERSITLGSTLDNRPLNEAMKDLSQRLDKLDLNGITYRFTGQADQMSDTFRDLGLALVLSLILIYMILAILYESVKTPFIRMFSLPLGLIGSLFLLFLTNQSLNLYSLIGILVMDGLVAKNGTLLLDYTLTLMERGLPPRQAIIEAGRVRLRPIFMTTLTMVVGMLPTALSLSAGSETRSSMAVVVIGGLLTSTVFTLLIIPIIFLFFENHKVAHIVYQKLVHVFH